MFNEDANTGNHLILRFIFSTEFALSGLFLRLIGHDMVRFKPLEACIFKERTAWRKAIAFLITNAFIVHASRIGATEVADKTLVNINNEVIFHRVVFFFTTILLLLLHGILGTLDATLRAINDEIHRYAERQRLFYLQVARIQPQSLCEPHKL